MNQQVAGLEVFVNYPLLVKIVQDLRQLYGKLQDVREGQGMVGQVIGERERSLIRQHQDEAMPVGFQAQRMDNSWQVQVVADRVVVPEAQQVLQGGKVAVGQFQHHWLLVRQPDASIDQSPTTPMYQLGDAVARDGGNAIAVTHSLRVSGCPTAAILISRLQCAFYFPLL